MADLCIQDLTRLSHLPDNPGNPAELIAGQKYFDVEFTGGSITGVTISGLGAPLAIADGGTGQITANLALNALLPAQSGQSGKALKTDGTNTSWSSDIDTGITQLTGDVTAGPGSGSQAATVVHAPASGITGTTLSAGVTASSLTSVGTLSSLTLGGTLAMGANNITMTGTLGATGARLTKGWFTDLQVTNDISGSITGNAATVTTNANLTGAVTSVGNVTSLGSFTSSQLATALTNETGSGSAVFGTAPTITNLNAVTPSLGVATITSLNFGSGALTNYIPPTSWVPIDGSGAGLVFTSVSANYEVFGKTVRASCVLTYPATASGVGAVIGGLPFTSVNAPYAEQGYVSFSTAATLKWAKVQANSTIASLYVAAGTGIPNSTMASTTSNFTFIYPIP